MEFKKLYARVAGLILIVLCVAAGGAEDMPSLEISPSNLQINAFYSGQNVNISGRIQSDRDVFIEIKGPVESHAFNVKGKVGPLWMNTKKVRLEHVPYFYLMLCPQNTECRKRAASLGIGLQTLKKDIVIEPEVLSLDELFERLVQLKRSEKLYDEIDGAIKYFPVAASEKEFKTSFLFPSAIVPAEYSIVTTLVHNGIVEKTLVRNFQIKEAGVVQFIRQMANHRELFYGITSVVIAILAGLAMGYLFKGTESH